MSIRKSVLALASWSRCGLLATALIIPAFSATAQQGPMQIVWAGPLTGDVAQLGQGYLSGVQLAIAEWNAKGGVLGRQIDLVTEDDACDPKQASNVATKIADDPKNVLFIGHFCSGTTLAGGPIISKENLPMISVSSNPAVTQQGWKNHVRVVASDTIQGRAIVVFAKKRLGVTKFAILHDNQAMGEGVGQVANDAVAAEGGTVTSMGGIDPKDFDYTAVLTKIIKAEDPDAILYCTNFPTSAGLVVKQSRQLGFKKPILGCDGFMDQAMIQAAGAAAERVSDEEIVYFTFQSPPYSGEEASGPIKAFAERYRARYGKDPSGWESYGYDAGNVAMSAIQKAGSTDKQAIINVLHSEAVPGVLIPEYRFDQDGNAIGAPMFIYSIIDGKFRLVEQFMD